MFTINSAPADFWTPVGPTGYQMSSQILTPTDTPDMIPTGHFSPWSKYLFSSKTP